MLFSYKKINDEPAIYKVDGKEVTKEEYDKAYKETFLIEDEEPKLDCPNCAPKEDVVSCLSREPEFKSLGETVEGEKVSYRPVTLTEQIIDQFVEDCYHDKTDYYVDMVELDCGEVVMSIVRKDNPKYVTTMVFEDEYEAAQFCFDIMNGRAEFVPEISLDEEENK